MRDSGRSGGKNFFVKKWKLVLRSRFVCRIIEKRKETGLDEWEKIMKIVEINCPSCGAKLRPEDARNGMITCAYCGNQFLVDEERRTHISYTPLPVKVYQEPESRGAKIRGMIAAICAVIGIFCLIVVLAINSYSGLKEKENNESIAFQKASALDADGALESGGMETGEESGLYCAIVGEIFGRMEGVTVQELEQVKYLRIEDGAAQQIWYSFGDPYAEETEIMTASFSGLDWNPADIGRFTGLVKLEINYGSLAAADLSALTNLRGLGASGTRPAEIAEAVGEPARITDLELKNIDSMEGIAAFENLERLSVQDMPDTDLKELVALKHLKELSLEDTRRSDSVIQWEDEVRVTDYSAVSAMTGLESLSLSSDMIRDIGMLKPLVHLKSLTLEDSSAIGLEALSELTGLEKLCLTGNDELQSFEPVGALTGLKELTVDKLTSQPDPDLSALKNLEKLEISGFMSVSSLRDLSGIRELSIHGCNVDGADALSTLTNVERLTFYSVWTSGEHYLSGLRFLDGMTGLKYADFNGNLDGSGWSGYSYGLEVAGDISSIFNHPGLEELYVSGGTFEIDFDKIGENASLRALGMNGMSLHENYHVEAYNGMVDMWYDDVSLKDHLDFLKNFPNLEELYLDGNELTDVEFTEGLTQLTKLSVKDNYITDLSPLVHAEHLAYLDISDNPVSQPEGMDDKVTIIQ